MASSAIAKIEKMHAAAKAVSNNAFSSRETAFILAMVEPGAEIGRECVRFDMTRNEARRILSTREAQRIIDSERAARLVAELAPRSMDRLADILDKDNPLEASAAVIGKAAFSVLQLVERKREKETEANPVGGLQSLTELNPDELEAFANELRAQVASANAIDAEFSETPPEIDVHTLF